jgi:Zn-dependent protease with chaperone function
MRLLVSNVLLALAWFAATNLVASAAAWTAGKRALARQVRPRAATLLALRLLPSIASIVFVAGIFLPSHWLYEPVESQESFGFVLSALAMGGAIMLAQSLARAAGIVRHAQQASSFVKATCNRLESGVFEVGGLVGVSLAGILRPRILIGSETLAALTPAELDLAISHEAAHRQSRDNLKRFLICSAPDVLRWTSVAAEIEERWHAETECQADAHAVGGNEERAATLASALVKVAQLARPPRINLTSPAWSAFHVPTLLETRVRRLVDGRIGTPATAAYRVWTTIATLAVAIPLAAWTFDVPYTLHKMTEALVAHLP